MGTALFLVIIILLFGLIYLYIQYKYYHDIRQSKKKNQEALDRYKTVAEKAQRKLNEKTIVAHKS